MTLGDLFGIAAPLMLVFGIGQMVERIAGASHRWQKMLLSFEHWLVNLALTPAAAWVAASMIGALGGGLISLPDSGVGLLWALPVFVLSMELADYLFHRALHAWPVLWRIHSLHHSDTTVDTTTTLRFHWAEGMLRAAFVFPAVFALLKPGYLFLAVYNLLVMWGYVAHLNVRLSFGRLWPLWISPQFHRIHHAADPALGNRNFAQMLPIFDLIFGTAYRARADEYPRTGVIGIEEPRGLFDIAFWPLIRRGAASAANPAPSIAAR